MNSFQSAFLAQELSHFLIAYKFQVKDNDGKDILDKKLIQQAKMLSSEDDRAVIKQVEDKEESKEESKGEEQESVEPVDIPDLPKFKYEIIQSSTEISEDDKKEESKDILDSNKTKFVLLKFESEQDALKYIVRAKEHQCFLNFLSG